MKVGVLVFKMVLLFFKEYFVDIIVDFFFNLVFLMDWNSIFEYIGFFVYMKFYVGGGWKNVYKVISVEDFFDKYNEMY